MNKNTKRNIIFFIAFRVYLISNRGRDLRYFTSVFFLPEMFTINHSLLIYFFFSTSCSMDGNCTCKTGYYGSKCDSTCLNCKNNNCNTLDGTCIEGCKDGYYTSKCTSVCPSICKTCSQSESNTVTCSSCADAYYNAPTCTACSGNCKNVTGERVCNAEDGSCLNGCKDGLHGTMCQMSCGKCSGSPVICTQDGSCSGCQDGYTSFNCSTMCGEHCFLTGGASGRRCHQNTQYCLDGCETGYYGQKCDQTCSPNCKNKACDISTGSCTSGCNSGYYGSDCMQTCSNCQESICDTEGYCQNGCVAGMYGRKCLVTCKEKCTDGTCDSTSGVCGKWERMFIYLKRDAK